MTQFRGAPTTDLVSTGRGDWYPATSSTPTRSQLAGSFWAQPTTRNFAEFWDEDKMGPILKFKDNKAQIYRPITEAYRPTTEAYRPTTEAYRPTTEVYRPTTEVYRPTTEVFRPTTDAYRPTTEPYRPITEADRPTTKAYRPTTEAYHPTSPGRFDGHRSRHIDLDLHQDERNGRAPQPASFNQEITNPRPRAAEGGQTHLVFAQMCVFCRSNNETRQTITSHPLKDAYGRVVCPALRRYTCPRCGATGDDAHTLKYCEETYRRENQARFPLAKPIRLNATGRQITSYN